MFENYLFFNIILEYVKLHKKDAIFFFIKKYANLHVLRDNSKVMLQ